MIPLSYFVLAWLALLAIYVILSFLSIIQLLRFSVSGGTAYFSTTLFLLVALSAVAITAIYLGNVDLQSGLDLGNVINPAFITP